MGEMLWPPYVFLGDVARPQYGEEHYLSECLWDSEEITVKGFLWGQEGKEISLLKFINSVSMRSVAYAQQVILSEARTPKHKKKSPDTLSELYRLGNR